MRDLEIFIIEDDVKIAEIQQVFVEKLQGFTVTGIAHSLAEARAMAGVLRPHLILLDIMFPDGSGIDFLWEIRRTSMDTDIILITAAKEVEFFQEGLRAGVFDYILKPLVFSRFEATLNRFREHRRQLAGLACLSQDTVDQVLHGKREQGHGVRQMPKGIDPITLEKISALMDGVGSIGISAEEAGKRVGVSRTTSRRYLEYLVAGGVLLADLSYGTAGRPERVYRKK